LFLLDAQEARAKGRDREGRGREAGSRASVESDPFQPKSALSRRRRKPGTRREETALEPLDVEWRWERHARARTGGAGARERNRGL
jgi:hypothetical protein